MYTHPMQIGYYTIPWLIKTTCSRTIPHFKIKYFIYILIYFYPISSKLNLEENMHPEMLEGPKHFDLVEIK